MNFVKIVQKNLYALFFKFGFVLRIRKDHFSHNRKNCLNLNIGCGDYILPDFVNLDFIHKKYHKGKKPNNIMHFDMRNDDIPFSDNTVDNIYVSHVIEHIEKHYVDKFFSECFRVMKKGAVLRIAVPDFEFLFNVGSFQNEYFAWRQINLKKSDAYIASVSQFDQVDFFIREVATPKGRYYKKKVDVTAIDRNTVFLNYQKTFRNICAGLKFREENSSDHITPWDYSAIAALAEEKGFSRYIKSKCEGSVSSAMQGPLFDRTVPQMSLYVDIIK